MAKKKDIEGSGKTRRSNDEGSFTQRKDGRWQGSQRKGEKRHVVYGKTKNECAQKLRAKMVEVERGKSVPTDRITVAEWSKEWLEGKLDYRPQSSQHRKCAIRWIELTLGPIQLQKLTGRQVQRLFIAKMAEAGRASSTINGYYGVLYTMCKDAVLRGILAKNPCEHVALPQIRDAERPVLSIEQVELFLAELDAHWCRPIVELAVYTAMREGELLSLKWANVDFGDKALMVRSTVSYVARKGFVSGDAKTASSVRRIDLSQPAIDLLVKHRAEQETQALGWKEQDLVFSNSRGGYWHGASVDRVIKKAVIKLGLPRNFTFHCFRHTAVALLIKAGAHPKMIQEICGHATIEMTMNLYGHLFKGMHKEAIDKLGDAFASARIASKAVEMAVKAVS
jgi:integrase